MEFVNPGFLFGLFAISIPIIIHLFNFRRFKKIYFSNVSFIRELKLQTQKQSRLKHLLILLMRILAIAAIVLAFAQPYFPVSKNIIQPDEKNAVSLYIDNSFSMQASSEQGILLDEAKDKAKEVASVYKDSDLFQLLTNDFEGRHQRFVSREEFLDMIDEIQISPVVKTLPEIISRQQLLFDDQPSKAKTAFIVSDFQQGFLKGELPSPDSLLSTLLILVESINKDNLYIDSCWFETPVHQLDQNTELKVNIRNSSANSYERIPVKLTVNGKQKAIASFDIKENGVAEVSLPYTHYESGIQNAELEISDFTINFDDKLWFSYTVSSLTPILCINGNSENVFLNSLFEKDSLFTFENINEGNIGYSDFARYRLIILNELTSVSSGLIQQLIPFLTAGGSLMVLPFSGMKDKIYSDLLHLLKAGSFGSLDTADTRVSYINLEHPIYSNVFDEIPENLDLPVVFQHFPIQVESRMKQDNLLELQTRGSFLSVFNIEKGKVYLFAVPFQTDFSTFTRHAIFVPTLYKIAISSVIEDNLYYIIGEDEVITLPNIDLGNDEVLHLKLLNSTESGQGSNFDFIPEHRRQGTSIELFTHGQISLAGNYDLLKENLPVNGISFNYNRAESEMQFYSSAMLNEFISEKKLSNVQVIEATGKPFAQALSDYSQGIRLWKLFVILALAFLLAEALLLRFLK